MDNIYSLKEVCDLKIDINKGDIIFLYGDLGSGKTSLIRALLKKFFNIQGVKSPTYIHYKKYLDNIYHFDLYRLDSYDDFVNIGGEEILDNKNNICLIEWPEILEDKYAPSKRIFLSKVEDENFRKIIVKN